ncbi:response regulator [Pseudonocardia spinosispora]|uniref:response regulator n=1 Tax=Pseudonocardia spinosispora TaxID=103441 RepID=UPI00041AE9F6|nr:response regulator [Pseudonocardia spinosispora]
MTRDAKVLAVDDRSENLIALEAILQGLPVEITSVTSGDDALKRLLLEDYAVILLDAQMPGMDGFETASHIKQRERTRRIPIVFLTAANYDPHLAFRGYQLGAVDYLTKPLDPWVLRSKVQVFADLWKLNTELAAQASECTALRRAISDTLELLGGPGAVDGDASALIARARARLVAAQAFEATRN